MNLDEKKRKVQQKYREKLEQQKAGNKSTLEAIVVISSLFIFIVLFTFFEGDRISHSMEDKWMRVVPIMDAELKDNLYYTGIAVDFNPKPIKIYVRTLIKETDVDAEEVQDKLINEVNHIIETNKLPNLLEESESYEIIIEGKKFKELTREVFRVENLAF